MNFNLKQLKLILIPLLLILLSGLASLFYNQKGVKAQETLICDKEIPIGESMDKDYELLENLFNEHQNVIDSIMGNEDKNILGQIPAAAKMLELASKCGPKNCHGGLCVEVCIIVCWCVKINCWSKPSARGACPKTVNILHSDRPPWTEPDQRLWYKASIDGKEGISSMDVKGGLYGQVKENAFNEKVNEEGETVAGGVIGASGNIIALIKGEDTLDLELRAKGTGGPLKSLFSIPTDVLGRPTKRTITKKLPIDANIRLEGEPKDKQIIYTEYINRKLNVARQEFTNCALTPHEISALAIGEEWPRAVVSVPEVIEGKVYRLPERLRDECLGPCEVAQSDECFWCMYKSLLNYYCCH